MLIVGLFIAFPAAQRALMDPGSPLAARVAQVLCVLSVAIFLWPMLKGLFSGAGSE